jgi:hypothetical protein
MQNHQKQKPVLLDMNVIIYMAHAISHNIQIVLIFLLQEARRGRQARLIIHIVASTSLLCQALTTLRGRS